MNPAIAQDAWIVAWLLCLSVIGGFFAYFTVFTGFRFWDDEGYMMGIVKQVLDGHQLYNDVPSSFGPFYFLYAGGLHLLSGAAVTHDFTRLATLLPWLGTAFVQAWLVLRLTRSVALASIAQLASVQTMIFFRNEPGHPQELCTLLLAAIVGVSVFVQSRRLRSVSLAALGSLCAALVLVKINIGVFTFVALAIALLGATPPRILTRVALRAAQAAGVVLPIVLVHAHLDDSRTRTLCALVVAGMVAAAYAQWRRGASFELRGRDCWMALAGFLGAIAVALLALTLYGSSLRAVLDNLLLMNYRVYAGGLSFFVPPNLTSYWIGWAIVGVVAAVWCAHLPPERQSQMLARLKVFIATGVFFSWFMRLSIWPGVSVGWLTPFCWLVLFPPNDAARPSHTITRSILCYAVVLQMLYVYPYAGSHLRFVMVPQIVLALVCGGDAVAHWRKSPGLPAAFRARGSVVGVAVMLAVVAISIIAAYRAWRSYEELPSLGLAGASRVHVPAQQAAEYGWLVREIQAHCDAVIVYPGSPSLGFWSGLQGAETYLGGEWMYVLDNDQQRQIVERLERIPNACVVHNPPLVSFWNEGNETHRGQSWNLDRLPLVQYIQTRFRTVGHVGDYQLLVRNERRFEQAIGP